MNEPGRRHVEFALDKIGRHLFGMLAGELLKELTGLVPTPADGTVSSTMRLPSFLGGGVWSGVIAVYTVYVSRQPSKTPLAEYIEDQLQKYESVKAAADTRATQGESLDSSQAPFVGMDSPQTSPFDFSSRAPSIPDYLIFQTNARLDGEELRQLLELIEAAGERIGLRGYRLWHHADIDAMLAAADRTRRKYIALLAPQDVFGSVDRYDIGVSAHLARALWVQAINELKVERYVRLPQLTDPEQSRMDMASVAIDLPLVGAPAKAARYIIEASDEAWNKRQQGINVPSILLLGGPGQGKSTITRLVSQAYRIALLKDSLDSFSTAVADGLQAARIPLPSFRRWPVRVDMASYVDDSTTHSRKSLIKYIAEQAEDRSSEMTTPMVRDWLRAWPWLLILDGFDEVASTEGRDALLQRLSDFMGEVEGLEADVFILATTRPQGYAEEFAPHGFLNVTLDELDTEQAVDYGLKLARARHVDDPEMLEKVSIRLRRAKEDRFTARLMQSPLQVSILSTLLESRERVPKARYGLFQAYYETVYARETGKPGRLATLLEERPEEINALHDWLGLILQANSEQAGDLNASIPKDMLRANALERLLTVGHAPAKAAQLAEQIVQAVTTRLVLIVGTKDNEVGFEVRSLQEFFAARAIASGPDGQIVHRLRTIVEPAHWRNTWLFAAGRVFSDRGHLRLPLISIFPDVDNLDLLRGVVAPGADLALDLLSDNLTNPYPGLQRNLYRHALALLNYPPDPDLRRRIPALYTLAEDDSDLAFWLDQAVDQAIGGSRARLEATAVALAPADRGFSVLAQQMRPQLRRIEELIEQQTADAAGTTVHNLGELLRSVLTKAKLPRQDRRLAQDVVQWLVTVPVDGSDIPEVGIPRTLIDQCLDREPITRVLAEATVVALRQNSQAGMRLRSILKVWVQRRPLGGRILELTYPSTTERSME